MTNSCAFRVLDAELGHEKDLYEKGRRPNACCAAFVRGVDGHDSNDLPLTMTSRHHGKVESCKFIKLRWPALCDGCSASLPAGTGAWWASIAKVARCDSCHVATGTTALDIEQTRVQGVAGASVRREYERKSKGERARKEAAVAADSAWRQKAKKDRPVLGHLAAALTPRPVVGPESQSTRAWSQGEAGELRVAEILEAVPQICVLHDRGIPSSKANIDHLAVGPAGVFVIDAKKYAGKVEKRDRGGWFHVDERLYVGGRDRSKAVEGVEHQVGVVRSCLGSLTDSIPVHGVLCFVGAEWPLVFPRPVRIRGVTALWPKALTSLVMKPGQLDTTAIHEVSAALAKALRPA